MWPNDWPQNISGSLWHISWVSDFAMYIEDFLLEKCHIWDITSMWPDYSPQNISRSLWPTFHGSLILTCTLNTFWCRNVISELQVACDPIIDLKVYLDHCDLYFMVQWLCRITRRLFDGEMSYLEYKFHMTQWFMSKYILVSVTLISWFSDFALYLEDYFCWRNVIFGILVPCDPMIDLKI